ncbi:MULTISPECIES: peptidoglycan recognition protein [unclassified Streptomyces]|uniref:peptidoglycan recognition protein family protein n=1 Tax=unclassified Streptomyces TaxID=2593676 RepID=UPI001E5D4A9B|nr:peptidoglycan recognition protein [Streptomyces sp. CB02980]MCB8908288.1 peptidoglycan recognition protein [Streptomyces sp. CB02980]
MRCSLVSSIAVTCATVLALPVSLAAPAAAAVPSALGLPPAATAQPPAPELPGATQSLPLEPLDDSDRSLGGGTDDADVQGLTRRDVRPFSLVGVVWDDPAAALHGVVQVRTRATGGGAWSEWQDVETHNEEHGADPDTAEGHGRTLKGSTAPLWVGDSDGVEIRVRGDEPLPEGLRLELVDPGEAPGEAPAQDPGQDPTTAAAPVTAATTATTATTVTAASWSRTTAASLTLAGLSAAQAAVSGVNTQLAPFGAAWIPALSKEATELTLPYAPRVPQAMAPPAAQSAPDEGQSAPDEALAEAESPVEAQAPDQMAAAKPYIGPRPKIITRAGWGADERIREKGFVYTKTIKAAFVHHSATGNNYTCAQAPSVLRSIYRYHVQSSGWRDFGYNFAVDKCGNIYEGRAGGVAKPVLGAHTLGFNTNSMGIAVLGTFTKSTPPAAVVTAVARLTAWKLGLHGVNPKGSAYLVSGGGNLYKKGSTVKLNAIAGHRDGFATECPGAQLYGKLGTARTSSAKYQGRS